eukprot:jgi/Picsp_1/1456/NSC_04935-R1_s-adenosylmethionine-dependent methyltransferase domain-containing protein
MKGAIKRGDLSKLRIKGKSAVELGAGMGFAGMAFALMGANVILTDITEPVLELLRHNVSYNLSKAALRLRCEKQAAEEVGDLSVQELDWAQVEHYDRVNPPIDYILAADCVYNEKSVPVFLQAVIGLMGQRSTAIICNEFRSQTVHDEFMKQFGCFFNIRKVPSTKMDKNYRHALIHIYILKLKKTTGP